LLCSPRAPRIARRSIPAFLCRVWCVGRIRVQRKSLGRTRWALVLPTASTRHARPMKRSRAAVSQIPELADGPPLAAAACSPRERQSVWDRAWPQTNPFLPRPTETPYWVLACNPKKWAIDRFLADGIRNDEWGIRKSDSAKFAPGQLALVRVGVDQRSKKGRQNRPKLQPSTQSAKSKAIAIRVRASRANQSHTVRCIHLDGPPLGSPISTRSRQIRLRSNGYDG
jgi:hypothetical protein